MSDFSLYQLCKHKQNRKLSALNLFLLVSRKFSAAENNLSAGALDAGILRKSLAILPKSGKRSLFFFHQSNASKSSPASSEK